LYSETNVHAHLMDYFDNSTACLHIQHGRRTLSKYVIISSTHVINVCFQHPITKMFIETSVHATTKNRILIRKMIIYHEKWILFYMVTKIFSEILNLILISSPSGLLWCVHCKSDILRSTPLIASVAPPFSSSGALSTLGKSKERK